MTLRSNDKHRTQMHAYSARKALAWMGLGVVCSWAAVTANHSADAGYGWGRERVLRVCVSEQIPLLVGALSFALCSAKPTRGPPNALLVEEARHCAVLRLKHKLRNDLSQTDHSDALALLVNLDKGSNQRHKRTV